MDAVAAECAGDPAERSPRTLIPDGRLVVCLGSGNAQVPFEFLPGSSGRSCTVYCMPIRLAAQGFAESSGRQRDRREGPGCCGLDEELRTISEVGRDGAPRIGSATGAVLINETNGQVANAMCETPDGERQPAERILT